MMLTQLASPGQDTTWYYYAECPDIRIGVPRKAWMKDRMRANLERAAALKLLAWHIRYYGCPEREV